jgi:outer membrane lipoprotein LolB
VRSFLLSLLAAASVAVAAVAISGCAALAPLPPAVAPARTALAASERFELAARFTLRADAQNHSGRLDWQHSPTSDQWLLSSPFGQGIAQIVSDGSGARLIGSDGRVERDADLDTLTRRVLGYPLPLAGLADWVRGVAGGVSSSVAAADTVDPFGRPLALVRDGWRIDYAYDGDAADAPPSRLFISRPDGPELRLRIDEWRLQDSPAPRP